MESTIENTDLSFLSTHFDFEAFLADRYGNIFLKDWENSEIPCINFKEITSDEAILLTELIKATGGYLSYFPVKQGLPKYQIVTLNDILELINNETFNWFEPLILFSNNYILINEPDIDKCFISKSS